MSTQSTLATREQAKATDHADDCGCGHDHGHHGHAHDHHHHHHHAGTTLVRQGPKVGRNDPCPCGSGKKHKKCCLAA